MDIFRIYIYLATKDSWCKFLKTGTDSLMFGPIRMAQLTSIVFLVAGIAGMLYVHYKGQKIDEFQVE